MQTNVWKKSGIQCNNFISQVWKPFVIFNYLVLKVTSAL